MNKTVTIIGASGQVGFRLAERLSHAFQLKCVVRDKNKRSFSEFENVEVYQVEDISCTTKLSKAIESSQVIVNTGYIWFAEDIFAAIEKSTSRIEQVIFTGSTGIFTKLPSKGAQQKRDAERFIRENYRTPWTIVRPTMIYGHPNDRNISRLAKALGKTPVMPIIGNGEGLIQPVFINDLLKAIELAILNEKHFYMAYNIGARFPLTNLELFRAVALALNKKVRLVSVNPKILGLCLNVLSILKIKPITHEQLLRFQENKDIDIGPFAEAFDFQPISFQDGVTQLVAEMKRKKDL